MLIIKVLIAVLTCGEAVIQYIVNTRLALIIVNQKPSLAGPTAFVFQSCAELFLLTSWITEDVRHAQSMIWVTSLR